MTVPATAEALEQQVTALDQRRRAIAEEIFRGNRSAGGTAQQDPAGARRLHELSRAAADLDRERQAAHRQLSQAREREVNRRAWAAAMPVMGAHRQLLAEIATLAGELASALADEHEMHATLRREAGASALPGLHSYSGLPMIERLQRLSEIARITSSTKPSPPAREQEQPAVEASA